MKRIFFIATAIIISTISLKAASPAYSWEDLAGSAKPYPDSLRAIAHPDTLTPVMITHIGRHGARFPTSDANIAEVRKFLMAAYDSDQLTTEGWSLLALADSVCRLTDGRWGELDSLGMAEQKEIAGQLYESAPCLFGKGARIEAMSSWKSRCVMSMYSFLHELTILDSSPMEISAVSGGMRSDSLLRFFDTNRAYKELKTDNILTLAADRYASKEIDDRMTVAILSRLAGKSIPSDARERREVVESIYALISGCGAMGIAVNPGQWLTHDEYSRCWASKNLSQYLRYSASDISTIPADMASPLLSAVIDGVNGFINKKSTVPVRLYFGHAETLMPLMSLMRLPRARYISSDLATVADHWRNFDIVPMAANITLTLFRSCSGKYYVRLDVNGVAEPLIPGSGVTYPDWQSAESYLAGCLADQ